MTHVEAARSKGTQYCRYTQMHDIMHVWWYVSWCPHPLQRTSVVIDNINIHVAPADQQPTHPDVPPSREAVCPAQLLTFDELTQLGDL